MRIFNKHSKRKSKSKSSSKGFKKGDIVKFKEPAPEEIGLKMEILEYNGDRCLVMDLIGLPINPTHVYKTAELTLVKKKKK